MICRRFRSLAVSKSGRLGLVIDGDVSLLFDSASLFTSLATDVRTQDIWHHGYFGLQFAERAWMLHVLTQAQVGLPGTPCERKPRRTDGLVCERETFETALANLPSS